MPKILILFWLASSFSLVAQTNRLNVVFQDAQGNPLPHALAGGLNNPQFSTVDLDGNGINDLLYFDRQGQIVVPFLHDNNSNSLGYTFAPQYANRFPEFRNFMLLRDYNCDGIKDIFAYQHDPLTGRSGIAVYQGFRDAQNKIEFREIKKIITFHQLHRTNYSTLLVSNIDLPAIDDIDGDGDLDILLFNSAGGYIDWFRNESQELGLGCDSLLYVLQDDCWGRLFESGISQSLDLSPRFDSCAKRNNWVALRQARHSGSTLLTLDMDNDGDKELILGDLSFNNLNLLTNNGRADSALMTSQEIYFPQNSTFANIAIFPAAFYEDVNNDGKKDLLAAPNIEGNSFNNQAWYYENTGSSQQAVFSFQQNNFLVDGMVDLGSYAAPAWVDLNGDSLLDLVIGNHYEFASPTSQDCYLVHYQNIGSRQQPVLKLVNSDFAQLKQYNLQRLVPSFGDLDADGDPDLMIGLQDGKLIYIENQGTINSPSFVGLSPNFGTIDVGQNACPQLVDADRDNDLDLIIGERNGNINYYENTGNNTTAIFSQIPTTATFGFVDTRQPNQLDGNSAPQLVDIGGVHHFFVGNQSGKLWHYTHIDSNLMGTFTKQNSSLDQIDEGDVSILAIADINQDSYVDIMIGNKRGGLGLYTQTLFSSISKINLETQNSFNLFPNPATSILKIEFLYAINSKISIEVCNLLGQTLIHDTQWLHKKTKFPISSLASGSYFLKIITNQTAFTKLFIKQEK